MAEGKKTLIYLIYNDLSNAVKGIGKKTFFGRPEPVGSDVANFIAIEIPTEIRSRIAGSFDMSVDCYATFDVYCKAKTDRTLNIGTQTDLVQKVLDVFPINGKCVTAANPTILMQGYDETGYQVTKISFKLRTKFNSTQTL
jgi:hypothetical protein